ncbi:MAG: hypothetical protein U1E32_09850 [Rhodoglobus sp.]|nr:hypothetical protein [Rhodoglobus sp.]
MAIASATASGFVPSTVCACMFCALTPAPMRASRSKAIVSPMVWPPIP